MGIVKLGIEKVLASPVETLGDARIGLICNQASVDRNYLHVADLFRSKDNINLTKLFGPQHGIRGDVQDNMVETSHGTDASTGLPVFSLYSETREPTAEMLSDIDAVVFDLQDVGCRVYTFIYTMANAMRACANHGKRFVVCDRPNPIGGTAVEGNLLEPGHESFVGQFPIPMRHGMTVGELAQLFNAEFRIGCDLTVVTMDGWSRGMYYEETGCSWVMPSPNMPTIDTAFVFPGTVYFEGTQTSEGRGTTRPFEQIGAPFVNAERFAAEMNELALPGVYFRSTVFMPTFQKHAGKGCGGVFIHVTEREAFKPVISGIALAGKLLEMYEDKFLWKEPPYEYEFERNPFDVISGSYGLRKQIESGLSHREIAESWEQDEAAFGEIRSEYLIY